MKPTLTRPVRWLLIFLAASGYMSWLSDLAERGEAAGYESPYTVARSTPHFEGERSIAAVISRDPFSGAPLSAPGRGEVASTAPSDMPLPFSAGSSHTLDVPDIAEGDVSPDPPALVARATIVGTNAVAYVESGTAMEVVRVGDTLGEKRVARIDLRGLTFADGTRLDLPNFNPTPLPAPATISIAQRLDEIKKLLTSRSGGPKNVPQEEGHAPSQATPSAAYPTPAPIATVDMRGMPAGTNPTPDANGSTPFPDPYPYAPAR